MPISTSCDSVFNVSLVENTRSNLISLSWECALSNGMDYSLSSTEMSISVWHIDADR